MNTTTIDVYKPFQTGKHDRSCAGLCTNYNGTDNNGPCDLPQHRCWCPDGALSYNDFNAKHPDFDRHADEAS